jgi:hypothetical protein
MKDKIIEHLHDAAFLEDLYRSDRHAFRVAFYELYESIADRTEARFWHHRLSYLPTAPEIGKRISWLFVLSSALLTGFLVKLPSFFGLEEERYYSRNISFILFTALLIYFVRKHVLSVKTSVGVALVLLAGALFINWLPGTAESNTLMLSCIHLPLFFWAILGFVFTGAQPLAVWQQRPAFLRYNGDLIVMTSLLTSAVGILSGITIGLFSLIGIDIGEFYVQWILVLELSACPLVATYILDTNPNLINKVSPIIARIFSPLVLVTLASKDPFNDREFLLLFNILLIGVLAIVFFSLVELPRAAAGKGALLITLLLSVVTIVVNSIALLAIFYRIASWGFTPNRVAVMGANLLFFTHLLLIAMQLFKQYRQQAVEYSAIERTIAVFLPLYAGWAFFVAVVLPFIFSFS